MKRHTVCMEELNHWVKDEWFRFAASVGTKTLKRLERSFDGRYRVIDHEQEIYLGYDMAAAIDAYNNAP